MSSRYKTCLTKKLFAIKRPCKYKVKVHVERDNPIFIQEEGSIELVVMFTSYRIQTPGFLKKLETLGIQPRRHMAG